MSKSNCVLKLIGSLTVGAFSLTASAGENHCSATNLLKSIGHESVNFVDCVNIDDAQSQFRADFLPVKVESASLYNRYQKQSLMAGMSGDSTAPVVIKAINDQVSAMYDVVLRKEDFTKYMAKLNAYYGVAKCKASMGDHDKTLVVACPSIGKFPSFKDVYHVSNKGGYQYGAVNFGQIGVLNHVLNLFQAKLEKLYVPKKGVKMGGVKINA